MSYLSFIYLVICYKRKLSLVFLNAKQKGSDVSCLIYPLMISFDKKFKAMWLECASKWIKTKDLICIVF